MNRREFERVAQLESQQRQAELEAQKGNPHFQMGNMEEKVREAAWNLCKEFDAKNRRRVKVLLSNFVTTELERQFGSEVENFFRNDWQEEVDIFCKKYSYAV